MNSDRHLAKEFENFVLLLRGEMDCCLETKFRKLPTCPKLKAFPEEDPMIMNKAIFDENWKVFRAQATGWWSLMAEYDLLKVDKADVKFDKFVTMLQVKYGYTREKAREEISRQWAEYEAKAKYDQMAKEAGKS